MKRWYLLAAAIAALIVWHAWFSQFNHDEIEHLHAAWLVSRGERPFTDFLEQHHPTLWYLLAPVAGRVRSVHALVFVARLFDLACLGAVLAAFVRLLRRVYPGVPVRWPLLLLVSSFMFVRNMLEVRPDPLMNALIYAGLASWVAFLQEHRRVRALGAGLLLGLGAAVLQKALVVVALVILASLVLARWHRADRDRSLRLVTGALLVAAGASAPVLALFAAVRAAGFWRDFWFWNYEFNRFFYLQAVLAKHFSVLVTLGISVAEDVVLWVAGLGGMALCARQLWRERSGAGDLGDARLGLLVVVVGYAPYLAFNRFPLEQYWIVLLPLLALFSAGFVAHPWTPRARARLQASTALMCATLACILLVYPRNTSQIALQRAVLSQTTPGDTIAVPPPYNPLFRRDAGYFWYNGTLIATAYEQYCRTRGGCPDDRRAVDDHRWATEPPRFVYLDDPSYDPPRWRERSRSYEPTSVPRLLRPRSALSARTPAPPLVDHDRGRPVGSGTVGVP